MAEGSIVVHRYERNGTASIPRSAAWPLVAVTSLTIAGLILRLAAARGDLWLDEIWTFRILDHVSSLGSIVFALPNDNNHLLNSAWLWIVGPGASPLLARLPAVIFGTLCIPLAAHFGFRRSVGAGVFAAAIVALDSILVQYGSEARGYSGMILAALLSLDRLDVVLDTPERRAPLLGLGLAVAFGTLSQLMMMQMSLVLGATALVRVLMRDGLSPASGRRIGALAAAVVGGTLPALVCLVVSVSNAPLHTGILSPFTWTMVVIGIGRMAAATLGLPDAPGFFGVAIALAACGGALGIAFVAKERSVFPALAIFGLPALQVAVRLPNEEFARFHFGTSLGLLVLAIEVVGRASRAGARGKAVALGAVTLLIVAQGYALVPILRDGRGAYRAAVARLGEQDPTEVILQPKALYGETRAVVGWYAAKTGAPVTPSPPSCAAEARWVLVARESYDTSAIPPEVGSGLPGCDARFAFRAAYPAGGFSGFTWLLFHRTAR